MPTRPPRRPLAPDRRRPARAEEWWRSARRHRRADAARPGRPVTVVDSGISATHPEFAGRPNLELLNPQEPARSVGETTTGRWWPRSSARRVNGVGIVGIYPEPSCALGRCSATAAAATSDIVAGIVAAAPPGPSVINLSLGGPDRRSLIEQAVERGVRRPARSSSPPRGTSATTAARPAIPPRSRTCSRSARPTAALPSGRLLLVGTRFVDLAAPGRRHAGRAPTDATLTPRRQRHELLVPARRRRRGVGLDRATGARQRPAVRSAPLGARDIGAPGRDDAHRLRALDVRPRSPRRPRARSAGAERRRRVRRPPASSPPARRR